LIKPSGQTVAKLGGDQLGHVNDRSGQSIASKTGTCQGLPLPCSFFRQGAGLFINHHDQPGRLLHLQHQVIQWRSWTGLTGKHNRIRRRMVISLSDQDLEVGHRDDEFAPEQHGGAMLRCVGHWLRFRSNEKFCAFVFRDCNVLPRIRFKQPGLTVSVIPVTLGQVQCPQQIDIQDKDRLFPCRARNFNGEQVPAGTRAKVETPATGQRQAQ